MAVIQKKQLMGEDATPEVERLRGLYETIGPGIEGVMTDYDTSGKNIMSLMGLFENPLEAGVRAMRNRAGDKDRELGWAELSWDRQKKGMEKVGDAAKGYLKKVADLRSFYSKLRSGDAVIYIDPQTGLTKEIDSSQLSPDQLASDGRHAHSRWLVWNRKSLKGDISENDVEWLDQGWDYTSKSLATTNAKAALDKGLYDGNFDKAVEGEWSLLQSKEAQDRQGLQDRCACRGRSR
ncbi:MAG: hypothetical protein MZV70_36195 [Desulfobacterales bacterium]|nr:hypothetical protein [Desulfobacterales bacterium]